MALFMKQDFNPSMLSSKWIAMQVRPNMLLYARQHIISILESGLLFREDSVEVEQEACWQEEGGEWLTRGERGVGAVAVAAAVALFPPRHLHRATLINLAVYLSLPLAIRVVHRRMCSGSLQQLLKRMRDYLALARRAAACLKECSAFKAQLDSVSTVLESMHTLLCRQQSSLAVTLARASSALLGNAPWLRADLAWDAMPQLHDDNLLRIHHAFLVVQSSLLKHIAMAHYMPSAQAKRLYRNHNERIYWIHAVLLQHLTEEFRQNYEALERMYRLLKNYGNSDSNMNKKPGTAIKDCWLYSDVHGGVARANLELKLATSKCNELDVFLDSCALNKHELDLDVLNKDIDDLVEHITTCLTTVQSSQIRLKKLQNKFSEGSLKRDKTFEVVKEEDNDEDISTIECLEPEIRDEVFYFIKTEDDDQVPQSSGDISTAPGKKERETTKIVLNELRRKLVRREDAMRERERQALAKSMPDEIVPEFPRQINTAEYSEKKGFITKLQRKIAKKRLFHSYKIKPAKSIETTMRLKKLRQKINRCNANIISKTSNCTLQETGSNESFKSNLFTIDRCSDTTVVTELLGHDWKNLDDSINSWVSDSLSDVEASATNDTVNQAVNYEADLLADKIHEANNEKDVEDVSLERKSGSVEAKLSHPRSENCYQDARNYRFSKRDLEISSSESECDFQAYKVKQVAILNDIRRNRAARKKSHTDMRAQRTSTMDEGLRPVEYSFGAGLAMASVLRVDGTAGPRLRSGPEEQFVGDGEVSLDSGNDD